jgi:redox-sensing transcriptional repressor
MDPSNPIIFYFCPVNKIQQPHFMKKLPGKTVERLSKYRRVLLTTFRNGKEHIFSHEIAGLLHITPVQVRRDLMLIGYTGTLRKGYEVKELIDKIGVILDSEEGQKVAVAGLGNLGRALIRYFKGKRTKLDIVASFDINPEKIGTTYQGVPCYDSGKIKEIIGRDKIDIVILTVPVDESKHVAEQCIEAGIKGILNYTSKAINVPHGVYLEEYDMVTSLEKVAFFSKGL